MLISLIIIPYAIFPYLLPLTSYPCKLSPVLGKLSPVLAPVVAFAFFVRVAFLPNQLSVTFSCPLPSSDSNLRKRPYIASRHGASIPKAKIKKILAVCSKLT